MAITAVHYWKLDEASGNLVDSVASLDMTRSGTVGSDTGLIGNAATFGGASNYAYNNSGQTAVDLTTGCTVWCWIKLAATTGRSGVYISSTTNATAAAVMYIAFYAVNTWRCQVTDSVTGSSIASDATATTTGVWHFACGRYNQSTMKAEIRIDGGGWSLGPALANGPITPTSPNITTINRIITQYGTCAIDEAGISNDYLADADVDSLYNSGAGVTWPFVAAGHPMQARGVLVPGLRQWQPQRIGR